ncbi:hypothetical protein CJD36_009990 [Flavipsychrobacter stenotrophus]|uniref:Secretion system C-terminal sorting domain-containing protein n=1 Tax=Flavipsychrobacter stenotrophus TaxID=2077091 RepID=A0A2S7SZR8_9BACT|nr:T9SS type A sorting domain-containing protein [Flavipsychrobacter stenotrophus]PQJ12107.1 hypothetical protein CJD36_009990 [Flavipsychrobacter stenotrophus]
MKKIRSGLNRLLGLAMLAGTTLMHYDAAAQADYWSIFGNSGCTGGSYSMANTGGLPSASSFSAISPVINPYITSGTYSLFAHTVYNKTGQPLFSVDYNGIYGPNGIIAFNFGVPYTTTIGGTIIDASSAFSEICTVPCRVAEDNHSYYAIFWAFSGMSFTYVLRVVTINISPSGALSFSNNILYDATSPYGMITSYGLGPSYTIAADAQQCNAPYSIYTTEPDDLNANTILRKWTFGADGSLPSASVPSFRDKQHVVPGMRTAKIFNLGTTPAKVKYYVFTMFDESAIGGDVTDGQLACWDITNTPLPFSTGGGRANVAIYDADAGGNNTNIAGFDRFVDDADAVVVSRSTKTSGGSLDLTNSGLAFFLPITRGNVTSTLHALANTSDYSNTDLERSTANNLFMVKGATTGSPGDGQLGYLTETIMTSLSPMPVLITSSCGSLVSVSNINYGPAGIPYPFYLGKQFENENISFPKITDITISNRCAPGSPGATAANPQYSTAMGGGLPAYNYLWTPRPPVYIIPPIGFPIPFYPNNAHLDNYAISNPTITSVSDYTSHGGVPSITSDFTLTVTDVNGCVATKEVKTDLITSGFDLTSRDSHFDLFNEANTQDINPEDGNDIWNSPDIFNRYHSDGAANMFHHLSPAYATSGSTTNYLYVNVHNVGCIDYDPTAVATPAKVHAYWTMGGFSAETWPNAWNGTGQTSAGAICDVSTHHEPLGAELIPAAVGVPTIATGSSKIVELPWTPPNPDHYHPPSCTPANTYMDFCFLSRIVDYHNISGSSACAPDGMTICEVTTGTERANVVNNNNIATINTNIIKLTSLPRRHVIVAGNGGLTDAAFNIKFVNSHLLYNTGISTISNYASIKVFLGDLFDNWKLAGSAGTFGTIDPVERSVVFDGSNTVSLNNIMMTAGKTYPIDLEFRMKPGVDGKQIPDEMVYFRQIALNRSIDTLVDTFTACRVDTLYDSVMTPHYDTTCYSRYDTVYHTEDSVYGSFSYRLMYEAPEKGVLAVTEMSNGASGDCEYAEMIVANCGTENGEDVDIRGWIIDDNAGNFNTSGCTTGVGTAAGHYRLAFDNIWSTVPVGSMLVMYNHDANCYNLSDTFRVDTTANGLVYWIPVGGTVSAPYGTPHVDRFGSRPNTSICSYCSDTGTTVYATASAWSNTIGLNNTGDAIQVRCPGCNFTYSRAPEFYHGIGYGPATGAGAFVSIAPGSSDLGGPVINGSGTGNKYVFTGSTRSDLGNPASWSKTSAGAAGTIPATLGNVSSPMMASVKAHSLDLPCCGQTAARSAQTPTTDSKLVSDKLKVYPNPTNSVLYFELSTVTDATIKIMDITGRIVGETHINNGTTATVDVSNYVTGVYIYQVITNGKIESGKVVVRK